MIRLSALTLVLAALALPGQSASVPGSSTAVIVERVPGHGLVPQAASDAAGLVHLVYFTGPPDAGDIFHTTRLPDGRFSTPVRVNSTPGAAIAIGSVRGAQIAVGPTGTIHVVWNGSDAAGSVAGGRPLLYARSTDGGATFSDMRSVLSWGGALDGGGSVAAGPRGRVYVAWHATPPKGTDAAGRVYLAQSDDDGRRFGREAEIGPAGLGACGCCSLRAFVDHGGALFVLFRAAGDDRHRDMTLLSSRDAGRTFGASRLDPWEIAACPLSTMSLADGPRGVVGAWETMGHVRIATVAPVPGAVSEPDIGTRPDRRKHPVVAFNKMGQLLVAWLEGTGWATGGSVAWQIFDGTGRPSALHGTAAGAPPWGLVAVAPLADGRFLLLY